MGDSRKLKRSTDPKDKKILCLATVERLRKYSIENKKFVWYTDYHDGKAPVNRAIEFKDDSGEYSEDVVNQFFDMIRAELHGLFSIKQYKIKQLIKHSENEQIVWTIINNKYEDIQSEILKEPIDPNLVPASTVSKEE